MSLPSDYIQAWVAHAERDLAAARAMYREEFYDVAAVFCQQAVEKILKAHFAARMDAEPPKVHRLIEFARLAGLSEDLEEELHALESDYIHARYPDVSLSGLSGTYEAGSVDAKIELAAQIIETVKAKLAEITDG